MHFVRSKYFATALGVALGFTLLGAIATVFGAADPPAGSYAPRFDPASFRKTVTHPYYPLMPGTTLRLIEKHGDRVSENEITVLAEKRVILGVACTVVRDVVREKGVSREETLDWFAQDAGGNVWYLGEDTREFEDGHVVSTEGSWEAGVKGAQPGIIMPASARPGPPYAQEYFRGHAEDMGQIVGVGDAVAVPFGRFTGCVRTREWSLLERGSEFKWYAKGVGLVRSQSSSGETCELVEVVRPGRPR